MTDEEREIFQGLVDEAFGRFKAIVSAGRPKFRDQPKELDKVATGQVFTTRQAIESGLVDREGFIEDAIDRALELAKLDRTQAKAVKYKAPFSFLEGLIAGASARSQPLDLRTLLDAATPKAWYLWSWPSPK
jgi:protease-4